MARTADSTLPWPEMITTCASTCRSRMRASVARPSMPGQPDVEHDDVEDAPAQAIEARLAAVDRVDVVALVAQHAAKRAAHARLVVNDQNRRHPGSTVHAPNQFVFRSVRVRSSMFGSHMTVAPTEPEPNRT